MSKKREPYPGPAVERFAFGAAPAPPEGAPIVSLSVIAAAVPSSLPAAEAAAVGLYFVPKLTDDGSCSAGDLMEEAPVDALRLLYALDRGASGGGAGEFLSAAPVRRLRCLQLAMEALASATASEWCGVYVVHDVPLSMLPGATPASAGAGGTHQKCLVKLAYVGAPSRAFFSLTEAFATHSNNSSVAMTRQTVIIHSVRDMPHEDPFYVCDAKVQSELCAPICDDATGEVIGIIDAEAWRPGHYTRERTAAILDFCRQLGTGRALVKLFEGL